jgi:fibronectin type 3 domain-containing protein/V8-like Glu-specific endopeptidase
MREEKSSHFCLRSLLVLISLIFPVFAVSNLSQQSAAAGGPLDPQPTEVEPEYLGLTGPSAIIGTDDRTEVSDVHQFPYRMIADLDVVWASSASEGCTGWFAGPHTIVTAGHCVYDSGKGGWAMQVDIYFERSGGIDYRQMLTVYGGSQCSGTSSICGPLRKAAQFSGEDHDYGAIVLDDDWMGNLAGWFVAEVASDTELDGRLFTVSGYPCDKPLGTQWWDMGFAQQEYGSWPADYLKYYIDTFGCQSGAPVYYSYVGDYYSNGLHKGGAYNLYLGTHNQATRITSSVLSDLQAWGASTSQQVCWRLDTTVVNGDPWTLDTDLYSGYECGDYTDYLNNSVVELTASPPSGHSVIWQGTDDDSSTALLNYATMDTDRSITATYLGIPSGLAASDGTDTAHVQLSWGAVTGANSYQIYRAESLYDAKSIVASLSDTSLNDNSVEPGVQYYYWVKACISAGCTDFSNHDTGWRGLSAPLNASASGGTYTDRVSVVWSASIGASSYEVWRATSAGGVKTLLASTASTSYEDTSADMGITYFYWIKACNNMGCSDFSAYTTGWRAGSPPSAPVGVAASDGTYSDKVRVTWSAVSGASSYDVWRSTSSDGTKTWMGSPADTTFDDSATGIETTYYYWVRACNDFGCSDYSDYDSGWRSGTEPFPPANVQASDGNYTNKVQVTWSIASGATYYQVWRATSASSPKSLLGEPAETSFGDTSASVGSTYYYWAKACNTYGCSDYSAYDTGWRNGAPPPAPANVSASDGTYSDNVQVTWSIASGATSYQVWRSNFSDGSKNLLGEPTSTSFDDTSTEVGSIYYYWVKACSIYGCSDFSAYNVGWRNNASPGGLSASDGSYVDRVGLSWSASLGAIYYQVYRSTSSGGAKTLLGEPAETSYDDTSATPGDTYYYWVKACNDVGCSDYSAYNTGWRAMTPPTGVGATDGAYTDKVRVTWSGSSGVTHYQVYRAESAGGAKSLLGSPAGCSYDDTLAAVSVTYYYWVKACNGSRCSDYSAYDTGWRASSGSPPATPLNADASDGAYADKIRITWSPSSGAAYYEVYRSTTVNGTKYLQGSPTDPAFDDYSAEPGPSYYYWVKACNGFGCSGFSMYDDGWRKCSPPTNVQASDGDFADKVQITWTPSAGASHYFVLRASSPDGQWFLIDNPSTASYDDYSVSIFNTYYYYIYACYGLTCSDPSAYDSGWRNTTPPVGVQASDGTYTDKVQITWSASPSATYYQVYRAETPGSEKVLLGSPNGTSFDDTSGVVNLVYTYWVKACASLGCSDFSVSDVGSRSMALPEPPANVQASDGVYTDKVRITWDPSGDLPNYEVWRSALLGGEKTQLANSIFDTYYDDTTAPPGLHYYWVKSCNLMGCSNLSDANSGWRSGIPAPLPFSDDFESAALSHHWEVYTSDEGRVRVDDLTYSHGGNFSLLLDDHTAGGAVSIAAAILHLDLSGSAAGLLNFWWREFDDENHEQDGVFIRGSAGESWCQVFSFNGGPNAYLHSNIDLQAAAGACGTSFTSDFQIKFQFYDDYPIDIDGYALDDISIYDPTPAPPGDVQASDGEYTDKVRVTWMVSPGASSYEVYRANSMGGLKISIGSSIDASYDDLTAMPGGVYYYWIKACNQYACSDFSAYDIGALRLCYTLEISYTGAGSEPSAVPGSSIGCPVGQYIAGETIALSASPAANYHLGYWSGTDGSSNAQFNMPALDHSVSAHYAPDGDLAVAIYDHATTGEISYWIGYNENMWDEFTQVLENDPQVRFGVTVIDELSPATLAGFERLVLPDNAIPDADLASLDAWFTGDRRIIAVDSAAAFAAYSGYLWPAATGGNGYGEYWNYSSGADDQSVVLEDKLTEDYSLGEVLASDDGDAQIFASGLPAGAVVVTTRHSDADKAYVAYRKVPGRGVIVLLGPYSPPNSQLHNLVRDAVEGSKAATLPFYDGFESGELGYYWEIHTDGEGRVQVSASYPYSGTYSLLLDDYKEGPPISHAAAILHLDLSSSASAILDFYWREFRDENHADDGVFIRSSSADDWCRITSFNYGSADFVRTLIDLQSAAQNCGFSFSPDFQIKFQFYDDYPIDMDGYAIDEVSVYEGVLVYLPLVTR